MKFSRRLSHWIAGALTLGLLGGMASIPSAAQTPTMTLERREYVQGDDISVQYTGTGGLDWIAIYNKGDVLGQINSTVYEYTYKTGQPDGTMDFKDTDRGDVKTLPPGEYDIYLLKDDGYEILDKDSFIIKSSAAITTDKSAYPLGERPVFTYSGVVHPDAWIGVYSADNNTPGSGNPSLVYQYTRDVGQPNGTTDMKTNAHGPSSMDALLPGEYYAYLFADDSGGYAVAASCTFTLNARDSADCPAPLTLSYDRTAARQGYADGSVSIGPPRGVEGLTGFRLYWGDESGPLPDYGAIPAPAAETGHTEFALTANTMIPYGATRLYAYAVYDGYSQSPEAVYTELPAGSAMVEEQPLYSFQVFSDTHILADPNHIHNRHLRMALEDIQKNDPDSIAIINVGDVSDNGEEGQYQQYNEIVNSFEGLPEIYCTPGNHDLRWDDYDILINRFLKNTNTPHNYYSKKIGDATFIMLGSQDVEHSEDHYAAHLYDDQMAFLKAELEKAADGMQPIFVFLHQGLYNTVAGTYSGQNWDGVNRDAEIRELFKQYPQVVFICGHSHYEFDIQSAMYAGNGFDANMFQDASVAYLSTDTDESKVGSQGLYIEVYADKLLVRGRDFVSGKWVPNAQFIVDISQNIKGLTAQLSETDQDLAAKKGQIAALLENIRSLPAGRQAEYQAEEQKLSALMKAAEEQENPPAVVKGDMDKSGEVTIQDVMEACKVLARQSAGTKPTEDELLRGDLDGDKQITITDVMEICKLLARKA